MSTKRVFLMLSILFLCSAGLVGCHIPWAASDVLDDPEEIARLTIEAMQPNQPDPQQSTPTTEISPENTPAVDQPSPDVLTPTSTNTKPVSQPQDSNAGPANATPTQTATQPKPKPSSTNAPLTITNITASETTIYYGSPHGGDPTMVSIQATIDPLNRVHAVELVYYFCTSVECFGPFFEPMMQLGIGDYTGDIYAVDAEPYMISSGAIQYWIDAYDVDGQLVSSTDYSLGLEFVLQIANFPVINSFSASETDVLQGDTVIFYWDTDYANCGVWLDGESVAEDGSKPIMLTTTGSYMFSLAAEGGADCTNPDAVTEHITINVSSVLPPAVIAAGANIMYDFDIYYDFDHAANFGSDAFFTIQNNTFTMMTTGISQVMSWYSGIPDYEDCKPTATAGWVSAPFGPGYVICFSTDQGNVGYVEIIDIHYDDATGDYTAEFSFVTWGSQ